MTFADDFETVADVYAEHFGAQTVTIKQSIGNKTNRAGEPEEYESDFATDLAADIRQNSGGEVFDGLQVEATITHIVRIPYTAGVTTQMWVEWGSRRLEIEGAVDKRTQGKFLYLLCIEEV